MRPRSPNLTARQPSEIARIYMGQRFNGTHYFQYYTTSQGGWTWDPRTFGSREECVTAAIEAGFTVPQGR